MEFINSTLWKDFTSNFLISRTLLSPTWWNDWLRGAVLHNLSCAFSIEDSSEMLYRSYGIESVVTLCTAWCWSSMTLLLCDPCSSNCLTTFAYFIPSHLEAKIISIEAKALRHTFQANMVQCCSWDTLCISRVYQERMLIVTSMYIIAWRMNKKHKTLNIT